MSTGNLVKLTCTPQTLRLLATGLTQFGRAEGEPEWLVSGVWLHTREAHYLVTASVEVLPNGFVARSLWIGRPADLAAYLEAELPDVSDRLLAHGNGMELPEPVVPHPPRTLSDWPAGEYEMHVLIRVSQRAASINSVACALLFAASDGHVLLVGADLSTQALVLSDDRNLIQRYRSDCDALTAEEYLRRAAD